MDRFEGKIAVVTGGGTGIGRELARKLAADGCHVAMCDLSAENMATTQRLCQQAAPAGTRITTCIADVSDAAAVRAFREHVVAEHATDRVHLLFNNAGIGGGGSFVAGAVDEWERVFGVVWGGVYNTSRAFIDLLVAADEARLVNVSSVNGFWATLGPTASHTSYSAGKFAVKGFSEALIQDLRNHAPHVHVSVVMPGHIGTDIIKNSTSILGRDPKSMGPEALAEVRAQAERLGLELAGVGDDALRQLIATRADTFRTDAPTTAERAAEIILTGVRERRWRILVGDDAHVIDRLVRESPEEAYEPSFLEKLRRESQWQLG